MKHAVIKSNFNQKMTLRQFNSLRNSEKWEILWTKGNLVDEALGPDYSFLLYSIDSFFVEIVFSLTDGKAIDLNAVTEDILLEKYLKKIVLIFS